MVCRTLINPPWLKRFVKTKFDEPCHYHPKHTCMNYCKNCMGEAFCDKCHKVDYCRSQNHNTLRVYKASRKIGVRTNDIKELWKISKIAIYTINDYKIVYLCSRKSNVHRTKPHAHKCHICGWEILSGFQYCSIACKMEGESKKGQVRYLDQQQLPAGAGIDNELSDQEQPEVANGDNNGARDQEHPKRANRNNKWPAESFRKRSRKGIPKRSPLF